MTSRIVKWLRRTLGAVRLRQLTDQLRHRLSFIPGMYVLVSIVVVQATLLIDRALGNKDVPDLFATTVPSARSVFTAIAGGLITSITLLLSMMLVTVQLASTQFSPRTLRDWLGDPFLKHTVGIALGTTVFSLLALRSTRSFGEDGGETVPHSSVIIAVILGVVSLFAVVRSVDHITQSLRVGSVARRIADDTIRVIDSADDIGGGERPRVTPSAGSQDTVEHAAESIPEGALAIVAPVSGWVQQIRSSVILDRIPDGSTAYVTVPLGGFVPKATPLMWIDPEPPEDDDCRSGVLDAFALGDTRTLQQDVGFGIVQLTDIAVRSLSPGVNDPTTATDIIVHLGDVLLSVWSQPMAEARHERDGRTVFVRRPEHAEMLRLAVDPIRRYGAVDPAVMTTLMRTLGMIRSEAERRGLPGPLEPLDEAIAHTLDAADHAAWAPHEWHELQQLARHDGRD